MKKGLFSGLMLLAGISRQAFASAGIANDGPVFVLYLTGFLLVLAGILKGIDYLQKNGKILVRRFRLLIRRKRTRKPDITSQKLDTNNIFSYI